MSNDDLQIPQTILKQLKIKPRLTKFNFMDKIDLLLSWAKNDEQKLDIIGIRKLENGDFCVNLPVLSTHFCIKERSLVKNFNLCNYERCKKQLIEDCICFTLKKDNLAIVKTYTEIEQVFGKEGTENWNTEMIGNWNLFAKKYPERKVSDFVIQFGTVRAILPITQLISYLIQSDQFDMVMFKFIFLHFSPMKSIPGKISSLLSSVFSRGWVVGEGPKTLKLVEPYGFLFNDGIQQIMMYNDHKCQYPGMWLVDEERNQIFEVECFFETYFPKEVPSNDNFIDIIIKYFPDLQEGNEEVIDNDENEDF